MIRSDVGQHQNVYALWTAHPAIAQTTFRDRVLYRKGDSPLAPKGFKMNYSETGLSTSKEAVLGVLLGGGPELSASKEAFCWDRYVYLRSDHEQSVKAILPFRTMDLSSNRSLTVDSSAGPLIGAIVGIAIGIFILSLMHLGRRPA